MEWEPEGLKSRLQAEGFLSHQIQAPAGSLQDALETASLGRRLQADWFVVDGDRFDAVFLRAVHASGLHTLLIDDFAMREEFPVDLIVNPNLDENTERYGEQIAGEQVLTGPSYVLLRREFRQARKRTEFHLEGNRILVTLGGSDPENLSPEIVAALAQFPEFLVTVIIGAGFQKTHDLQMLKKNNVQVITNPVNMATIMSNSDQAIIAAGGTLWELLSTGCTVLSYSRNALQASIIRNLASRGVVADLGDTTSFNAAELANSLKSLRPPAIRRDMADLGSKLVDGLGAVRVIEAMRRIGVN